MMNEVRCYEDYCIVRIGDDVYEVPHDVMSPYITPERIHTCRQCPYFDYETAGCQCISRVYYETRDGIIEGPCTRYRCYHVVRRCAAGRMIGSCA